MAHGKETVMYRVVKWTMLALSILYVPAALLVPFLAFLRTDLLCWILYGAFVLMTVFVWGIGGKANRTVGQGMDLNEKNQEIKITQELERSKHYWSQM